MNDLSPQTGGGTALVSNETAGQAAAANARALVEARYTIAAKFPRDMDVVREKLLRECRRPFFAKVAIYAKPVGGGEKVRGPSIRFAETAIRCMGNLDITTTTIYDDREKRIVHVHVTDLEGNTNYGEDVVIIKTVERKKPREGTTVLRTRRNSYGDLVSIVVAEDEEIRDKEGALISKALRTLGLRLVPGDLIDEAKFVIQQTQEREDAQDPDAAKRQLFDAFSAIGVTAENLKAYLGHDRAVLQPAELTDLRELYAAIRGGETTIDEAFEAKKPAPPVAGTAADGIGALAAANAGAAAGTGTGALPANNEAGTGTKPATRGSRKGADKAGATATSTTDAAAGAAASSAGTVGDAPPAGDDFGSVE